MQNSSKNLLTCRAVRKTSTSDSFVSVICTGARLCFTNLIFSFGSSIGNAFVMCAWLNMHDCHLRIAWRKGSVEKLCLIMNTNGFIGLERKLFFSRGKLWEPHDLHWAKNGRSSSQVRSVWLRPNWCLGPFSQIKNVLCKVMQDLVQEMRFDEVDLQTYLSSTIRWPTFFRTRPSPNETIYRMFNSVKKDSNLFNIQLFILAVYWFKEMFFSKEQTKIAELHLLSHMQLHRVCVSPF